jgi:hypothetical protein
LVGRCPIRNPDLQPAETEKKPNETFGKISICAFILLPACTFSNGATEGGGKSYTVSGLNLLHKKVERLLSGESRFFIPALTRRTLPATRCKNPLYSLFFQNKSKPESVPHPK